MKVWPSLCWVVILIPLSAALPSTRSDPRIINGTEAFMKDTRHQVSVRQKAREIIFGTGHICGGSLIAPSVVLSAAHCFYNDEENKFNSAHGYFVVMGTLNRFQKTENTVQYEITHILYTDFVSSSFKNDIALMFLDGTVPATNPDVKVIEMNRVPMAAGTVCAVTGWGYTDIGMSSDVLMTVDVPIIDNTLCSKNYGASAIMDKMICAGYMEGEKDACQGDSGGPLVCNGKLVGITSFGYGCADPGYPGVYTDVRKYADWVEENIAKSSAFLNSFGNVAMIIGLKIIFLLK